MDEEEDTTNKMPSQDLDLFLNEYVEQLFSQELDVNAIGLRTEVEDDAAPSFLRGGGGGDGTNVTNTTNSTNATTAITTDGRKRERSNNSTNGDENNNEEVQNATKKKETTVLKQNAHAQRRYRERIKQKSEEMEKQVKALQEKVRMLEAEKATQVPINQQLLEHKNNLYESQLMMFKRARRADIESSTMSSAMTLKTAMNEAMSSKNNRYEATAGETVMLNGMPEVPKQFTLPEGIDSLEEFKKQFPELEHSINGVGDVTAKTEDGGLEQEEVIVDNTLESLHYKWMNQISVMSLTNIEEKTNKKGRNSDDTAANGAKSEGKDEERPLSVKEASVDLINKMVDETCTLCMHIGNAIGRDNAKISFDYYDNMGFRKDFDVLGKDEDSKMKFYSNVVANLGLSEQQKQALIAVHDISKAQFRRLFEARARINDGMKELCAKGKENTKDGAKGLIRWLTGTLAIDISMDVVHKILEPKQAARYLTEMYPMHHHSGLVLCNAIYRLCK
ncbi:unnamed protein product [Bathycoccus prasinos]